jgi:hypothetical protein
MAQYYHSKYAANIWVWMQRAALILIISCSLSKSVWSQDYGPVQNYGLEEKLYSELNGDPITRFSYLTSEQSYQTEDSFGKEGTIRYAFKYADGSSDSVSLNFLARCRSSDSEQRHISIWNDERIYDQQTAIKKTSDQHRGVTKDAYDLFQLVCSEGETKRNSTKKARVRDNSPAQLLRECLADYVRRSGKFVPEGESTAYVKSRSDMTSMCQFAIDNGNHYWRN